MRGGAAMVTGRYLTLAGPVAVKLAAGPCRLSAGVGWQSLRDDGLRPL